ncbi:hypothetical protein ACFW04_013690 [Cataglyphis niger]
MFARDPLHSDIPISYQKGTHTYANRKNDDVCPAAFEGKSELAHAFFPSGAADFASEVHVDDEEPWHYHLLLTLTHEISHALSLQHSMCNDSVMFLYIFDNELQYPIKLSVDDILAVQNLYESHDKENRSLTIAAPTTTVAPITTIASTDPSRVDLCALKRLEAALIINRCLYIAQRMVGRSNR